MNTPFSRKHNRKNLRLPEYDYSQEGLYFVTIVTNLRLCLFGTIVEDKMILNDAGRMINQVCQEIPQYIKDVQIEHFIIMPNHFHGVIIINHDAADVIQVNSNQHHTKTTSLGNIVKRFKTITTRRYMEGVKTSGWPHFTNRLWQRDYYEHIVRNERDFEAIVDYIQSNPQNWEKDSEYLG